MAFLNSLYDDDPYQPFPGPVDYGPELPPSPTGSVPGAPKASPPPVITQAFPPGNGNGQDGPAGQGGVPGGGSPNFNFGPVPVFNPPTFDRPTPQDATNEPGYQFRLQGGSDALERSAAARGTLRTGGTLQDILEYGQNFASQEYGNVFNRALSAFDRRYQGARDAFAPQLAEWQTLSGAEIAGELARYQQDWERYQFAHRNNGGGGPGIPPMPQPGPVAPEPSNDPFDWYKTGNPPVFPPGSNLPIYPQGIG